MARFLEVNSHAKLYVHKDGFAPHYNSTGAYIGPDPALLETGRVILNAGTLELAEGLTLTDYRGASSICPIDSAGLLMEEKGEKLPEDFRHEQYLLIREGEKTVCISGCSHKGILNITRWADPDVLVGGFHFMNIDPETPERSRLDEAAKTLLESKAVFYTGHCTGASQFAALQTVMRERLQGISTGFCFEI